MKEGAHFFASPGIWIRVFKKSLKGELQVRISYGIFPSESKNYYRPSQKQLRLKLLWVYKIFACWKPQNKNILKPNGKKSVLGQEKLDLFHTFC